MQLTYVDCATNKIDFEDLFGIYPKENYLYVYQRDKLTVWDMSDPLNIKKVNEYVFGIYSAKHNVVGDNLFIWKEEMIEYRTSGSIFETEILVINVADPLNIYEERRLKAPFRCSGVFPFNGRVYCGIYGGIVEIDHDDAKLLFQFCLPHQHKEPIQNFIAHEDFLVSAGLGDGIRIFKSSEAEGLALIKHIPATFTMPNSLSWDVPGKSFFLIGMHDTLFKYDMTKPEKTKRLKGAKTTAYLCRQYVREGNNMLLFGKTPSVSNTPLIFEVDVSGGAPVVSATHEIKGYAQKSIGSDTAGGIVRAGDYLILATYYCHLGVVEIS